MDTESATITPHLLHELRPVFCSLSYYESAGDYTMTQCIQSSREADWFLENAKELKWFNGEDYEQFQDYAVEDSLDYYLNRNG